MKYRIVNHFFILVPGQVLNELGMNRASPLGILTPPCFMGLWLCLLSSDCEENPCLFGVCSQIGDGGYLCSCMPGKTLKENCTKIRDEKVQD